jgi:hypothetical protein
MNELKDQICTSWFAPVGSASDYPLLSKWVIYGEVTLASRKFFYSFLSYFCLCKIHTPPLWSFYSPVSLQWILCWPIGWNISSVLIVGYIYWPLHCQLCCGEINWVSAYCFMQCIFYSNFVLLSILSMIISYYPLQILQMGSYSLVTSIRWREAEETYETRFPGYGTLVFRVEPSKLQLVRFQMRPARYGKRLTSSTLHYVGHRLIYSRQRLILWSL